MSETPERECHVEPIEKEVDSRALSESSLALLAVSGMGCPNCAARVHNGLLSQHGVLLAEVELSLGMARVYFDRDRVGTDELLRAVAAAGGDGKHEYRAWVIASRPGL